MPDLLNLIVLPIALGLVGFIEPCSIGASLLFLKSVEPNSPGVRVALAAVFTVTRALFLGAWGAAAAVMGTVFLQFQRGGYIMLGALYVVLGVIYLTGQSPRLMRSLGPSLSRASTVRGSAALALLFGLNVPACSLPLLGALLASAAIIGAAKIVEGFLMLTLFGLGLSLPLLVAIALPAAQRFLERLLGYSARIPILVGLLFVVLGVWSVSFGVKASWADTIISRQRGP
jgi:cytochrome c-type biogenesis protein